MMRPRHSVLYTAKTQSRFQTQPRVPLLTTRFETQSATSLCPAAQLLYPQSIPALNCCPRHLRHSSFLQKNAYALPMFPPQNALGRSRSPRFERVMFVSTALQIRRTLLQRHRTGALTGQAMVEARPFIFCFKCGQERTADHKCNPPTQEDQDSDDQDQEPDPWTGVPNNPPSFLTKEIRKRRRQSVELHLRPRLRPNIPRPRKYYRVAEPLIAPIEPICLGAAAVSHSSLWTVAHPAGASYPFRYRSGSATYPPPPLMTRQEYSDACLQGMPIPGILSPLTTPASYMPRIRPPRLLYNRRPMKLHEKTAVRLKKAARVHAETRLSQLCFRRATSPTPSTASTIETTSSMAELDNIIPGQMVCGRVHPPGARCGVCKSRYADKRWGWAPVEVLDPGTPTHPTTAHKYQDVPERYVAQSTRVGPVGRCPPLSPGGTVQPGANIHFLLRYVPLPPGHKRHIPESGEESDPAMGEPSLEVDLPLPGLGMAISLEPLAVDISLGDEEFPATLDPALLFSPPVQLHPATAIQPSIPPAQLLPASAAQPSAAQPPHPGPAISGPTICCSSRQHNSRQHQRPAISGPAISGPAISGPAIYPANAQRPPTPIPTSAPPHPHLSCQDAHLSPAAQGPSTSTPQHLSCHIEAQIDPPHFTYVLSQFYILVFYSPHNCLIV